MSRTIRCKKCNKVLGKLRDADAKFEMDIKCTSCNMHSLFGKNASDKFYYDIDNTSRIGDNKNDKWNN